MSTPLPRPDPRFPGWLILLGALTAIGPLSIDMYLPAFPSIGASLHARGGAVELTLAAFLIGLSIGQAFYGPLADHFGRKPPIYAGLLLYVLASLGCLFAASIPTLSIWRFVQALGGAVGMVVANAVIRDRSSPAMAARAFATLMLIMGAAPILAPLLGALLLKLAGWRAIFGLLALFGMLCLIAVHYTMEETLERAHALPLRLGSVLATYGALLRDRQFVGYTLSISLANAAMFTYIAGAPFVLIECYGIPAERFGWVFATNVAGFIAASQLNGYFTRRRPLDTVLVRALGTAVLLMLTLLALRLAEVSSLPVLLAGLFGLLACMGFVMPNATALAMAHQGRRAGTASALLGSLRFGLGTVGGVAISLWHDGTDRPLLGVISACLVGSLLVYRWIARPAARDTA